MTLSLDERLKRLENQVKGGNKLKEVDIFLSCICSKEGKNKELPESLKNSKIPIIKKYFDDKKKDTNKKS